MIDTGAGVIDADYRGVVFVLLFNHSDKDFQGEFSIPGDKIGLVSHYTWQLRREIELPS
jgi:dUTPase